MFFFFIVLMILAPLGLFAHGFIAFGVELPIPAAFSKSHPVMAAGLFLSAVLVVLLALGMVGALCFALIRRFRPQQCPGKLP